jgi:hypothetical protein
MNRESGVRKTERRRVRESGSQRVRGSESRGSGIRRVVGELESLGRKVIVSNRNCV